MQLLADIEQQSQKTATWYLGGPTIVIKTQGRVAYVDPFFGPSVNPLWTRRFDPLIDPKNIRKVDAVIVTHEHRDHCNQMTIQAIEQNNHPSYFLPQTSLQLILEEYGINIDKDRIHPVKSGERIALHSFELFVLPSSDQTAAEAVSYLISTPDGKIFHAGDSLYLPFFFEEVKQFKPDIAFLPLGENPPGWNVYPGASSFLKMASEIEAKLTVPIHWDLWNESYLDACGLPKRAGSYEIRIVCRGGRIELPLA